MFWYNDDNETREQTKATNEKELTQHEKVYY